jgi:hypothetical protein
MSFSMREAAKTRSVLSTYALTKVKSQGETK